MLYSLYSRSHILINPQDHYSSLHNNNDISIRHFPLDHRACFEQSGFGFASSPFHSVGWDANSQFTTFLCKCFDDYIPHAFDVCYASKACGIFNTFWFGTKI